MLAQPLRLIARGCAGEASPSAARASARPTANLPALNNNLVNLVKTTTLAYAIGVPELLYAASQIWSESFNVREMMNVLLVTYVLLVGVLVFVMGRWEKAMRIPGYSA